MSSTTKVILIIGVCVLAMFCSLLWLTTTISRVIKTVTLEREVEIVRNEVCIPFEDGTPKRLVSYKIREPLKVTSTDHGDEVEYDEPFYRHCVEGQMLVDPTYQISEWEKVHCTESLRDARTACDTNPVTKKVYRDR